MNKSGTIQPISCRVWIPIILLIGMTLALFWPALGYDFVKLDDDQYICLNPHVLTGLNVQNVRWAFTTIYQNLWAPLLWISFMADAHEFGPGAFGFHLTNVLLHTINSVLLFWILFRLTGSTWRSFFVAAIFALHPLRVEAVAWITARKDVLSGLFFMLALLAYVRHAERPSWVRLLLIHLWMLLGLMTKSMLVILPPLLLLMDFWPLGRTGDSERRETWTWWRKRIQEKTGLFVLAVVFAVLNLCTHQSTVINRDGTTWLDRLGMVFPNYWNYLAKLAWPADLSILYPPNDLVHWPRSIAAAAGLVLVTAWAFRLRQRQPFWIVGWLWFLVGMLPAIRGLRFDPTAAYADRFTYLPSIGLSLALVWGAADLATRHPRLRRPILALGLAVLAACFARSTARLPSWKNSLTMFSELAEFAPDHFTAVSSYGFALMEAGRVEEALPYFARAAELKPDTPQAHADYADALLRLGRTAEAADWLQTALSARNPDCPVLNSLLGFAQLDLGRADLAIAPIRKALAVHPRNLGWRIELVRALFEAGDAPAALGEIHRLQREGYAGLRSFDDLIPQYVNWWRSGEKVHAWHFFSSNLQLRPDHIGLLNTAAWLLATTPDPPAPPEKALSLAQQAVALAPEPHPLLLDTLAAAFAATGQFAEARNTAQQALDIARQKGDVATVAKMGKRLAAYRNDQPWRE